jgi:hypothetical protein
MVGGSRSAIMLIGGIKIFQHKHSMSRNGGDTEDLEPL